MSGLLERLESMMNIAEEKEEETEGETEEETEEEKGRDETKEEKKEEEEDESQEESEEDNDRNVTIVAQLAVVGRKEARRALIKEDYDIVNAIMVGSRVVAHNG